MGIKSVEWHYWNVSSKFSHFFFVWWIQMLYMCRIQPCSQSAAALRYPLINLIWRSIVFLFFFPLVNSSAAVIRSVYFPHAVLSHVGHTHWSTLNGWQSSLWAEERSGGFTVDLWAFHWGTVSFKFCRSLMCPATCTSYHMHFSVWVTVSCVQTKTFSRDSVS